MNVYYCVTKRMTVTQDAKVSAQTFLLDLKTSVKVDYSIKDICAKIFYSLDFLWTSADR